jgi:hypothetical protein
MPEKLAVFGETGWSVAVYLLYYMKKWRAFVAGWR